MRRWPLGPIVAAIWFVLCGVYLLHVLGWDTFTALTPLDQALYAALALLPVPIIWGVVTIRRRAREFSAVSARLADQLDRLYTPSEDRDHRAQEALLALRRQAEELAGAVDNTVQRIEASAEGLSTRLTESMRAVTTAMERAEWARSDLEGAISPLNRLVETLSAESAAINRAVGRDLDEASGRLAEHVEDVEKAVDRALATAGERSQKRAAEIEFERVSERIARGIETATMRITAEAEMFRSSVDRAADGAVNRFSEQTAAAEKKLGDAASRIEGATVQLAAAAERGGAVLRSGADNLAEAAQAAIGHTEDVAAKFRETAKGAESVGVAMLGRAHELNQVAAENLARLKEAGEGLTAPAGRLTQAVRQGSARIDVMGEKLRERAGDLTSAGNQAAASIESAGETFRQIGGEVAAAAASSADNVKIAISALEQSGRNIAAAAVEIELAADQAKAHIGRAGESIGEDTRRLASAAGEAGAKLDESGNTIRKQVDAGRGG